MRKLTILPMVFCLVASGVLLADVPKPAPPETPEKIALCILYAGHPASQREKDFVEFLSKYYTQVRTGDLAIFGDKSADGFDVAILDYDSEPQRPSRRRGRGCRRATPAQR